MSVYRQAAQVGCPRCGIELEQYPDREKWRCTQCNGILLGELELEREIATLVKVGERIEHPDRPSVVCPRCTGDMTRATVRGIELDRCPADGSVWFDRGELGALRAKGHAQPITPPRKPR